WSFCVNQPLANTCGTRRLFSNYSPNLKENDGSTLRDFVYRRRREPLHRSHGSDDSWGDCYQVFSFRKKQDRSYCGCRNTHAVFGRSHYCSRAFLLFSSGKRCWLWGRWLSLLLDEPFLDC